MKNNQQQKKISNEQNRGLKLIDKIRPTSNLKSIYREVRDTQWLLHDWFRSKTEKMKNQQETNGHVIDWIRQILIL